MFDALCRLARTLPPTSRRVTMHTSMPQNARIRDRTLTRLEAARAAGYDGITRRLHDLDREWDTERTLMTHAAALVLAGSVLGLTTGRAWCALTGVVGAFMLQHALQGWCPPLPLVRARGVRTAREIHDEQTALKALRDDFARPVADGAEALAAAERM